MTDSTDTYNADYEGGIPITCILNEGAPTVTARTYGPLGEYRTGHTWASELKKGDWVALCNDTSCTSSACGGLPVVEVPVTTESLVIGYIDSEPELVVAPPSTAATNTLAERLAGKYYRIAKVVITCGFAVRKATIMCDGSNATAIGVGTTLKYNITSGSANQSLCFDSAANSGVGVIPCHYVAAGTDGDTASCTVIITGVLYAITGA